MIYQQTVVENFITSPAQADISNRIIDELRQLYYGHFDNYWFITLLEQNAFDTSRLRAIHAMLEIQSVYNIEKVIITDGMDALQELILTSKRYLIPSLRDKLRISGFFNDYGTREDKVMKSMFSYTFPHNLNHLEELLSELQKTI